jgi:hypothetical protein
MDTLNCSRQKAIDTLREVNDLGWLEVERFGSIKGTKEKRSAVYSLTAFATDTRAATSAFLKYQPQRSKIEQSTV